jgi:hypothetical protein
VNISLFTQHNDSRGVEYGQRNGETNFNNKSEHESVCQNSIKESASILPEKKYQHLNTFHTHHILLCVAFSFPKIEKFAQRKPFSVNCKHP